jgi:hypothetical protein
LRNAVLAWKEGDVSACAERAGEALLVDHLGLIRCDRRATIALP